MRVDKKIQKVESRIACDVDLLGAGYVEGGVPEVREAAPAGTIEPRLKG